MPTETLRQQYEAYPYPARDPADEGKRLLAGTPSSLFELEHYVFGGRLPSRLRLLSAGGGTGDAAVLMAQEAKDRGIAAEVVHLDLSTASQEIARARAVARGLEITFVNDSLLNVSRYGLFDYIDCCGVLHHLDEPEAGLRALMEVMRPEGGVGLMLYAPLGRTGVYPMQAALRRLTRDLPDPAAKVKLAKKLLADLPATNWLKRNPFMNDHNVSDAGLYDLLLHSQDRAYSVPEFAAFVGSAGLGIISFIEPVRYRPETWTRAPDVLAALPDDQLERAAFAEEISGSFTKHIAYLTVAARAPGAMAANAPEMIPFYNHFDGVAIGRAMAPGQNLTGQLAGLNVNMPMPRRAGSIMQRIDGRRDWRAIHADLAAALGRDAPSWEIFWSQDVAELYDKLQGINTLLLRAPA